MERKGFHVSTYIIATWCGNSHMTYYYNRYCGVEGTGLAYRYQEVVRREKGRGTRNSDPIPPPPPPLPICFPKYSKTADCYKGLIEIPSPLKTTILPLQTNTAPTDLTSWLLTPGWGGLWEGGQGMTQILISWELYWVSWLRTFNSDVPYGFMDKSVFTSGLPPLLIPSPGIPQKMV